MKRKLVNLAHRWAAMYWAARTGWPAIGMTVIGVTGTDGKTTTSTLIYEMLKAAGITAGLFSTVAVKWQDRNGDEHEETKGLHTTNPGPEILHPLLWRMKQDGVTHVVLETTSHGLDQARVYGCNFQIGVLTNITHEHLDYHKSFANYQRAKLKLFLEKSLKFAVLNQDDGSFELFKNAIQAKNPQVKIIGYGKTNLPEMSEALAGDYNKYNAEAAQLAAGLAGVSEKIRVKTIKNFGGVAGRRQEVKAGQKFRVIVDFAHTPNALEQLLTQMRKEVPKGKKLIAAFGCTGERDKEKRPIMGGIGAKLADYVIITSDDTRSELQADIYQQIIGGIPQAEKLIREGRLIRKDDRGEAVETAIALAKPGDVVVLAGKGHEKTILIGKEERKWNDAEEAEKAVRICRKKGGFA